jgi:hypothetical protein
MYLLVRYFPFPSYIYLDTCQLTINLVSLALGMPCKLQRPTFACTINGERRSRSEEPEACSAGAGADAGAALGLQVAWKWRAHSARDGSHAASVSRLSRGAQLHPQFSLVGDRRVMTSRPVRGPARSDRG